MQHNNTIINETNLTWAEQTVDELCSSILGLTSGGPLGYNMFIETRKRIIVSIAERLV